MIDEVDLRSITRDSDRLKTAVFIGDHEQKRWLVFGQAMMRFDLDPVELRAYLPVGVTDNEHDSAYALVLPLIGVKIKHVRYHTTILTGYVAPRDASNFHVPKSGYDPLGHPDTFTCDHCRTDEDKLDGHKIVSEDFYVPPHDAELYRQVQGRRVSIHIGYVRGEETE